MGFREEQQLMLKAARLYYEDNRTQDDVARVLHTSRPRVSRLLAQARESGIVQIRVIDPVLQHLDLEKSLAAAFGLADVIVVGGEENSPDFARRWVGQAAAAYLERTLQNGDVVGIGWGRTLHEVVNSLDPKRGARVTVVPLLGGVGQIAPVFQVHELARSLAAAFGGGWHSLYVPAMAESEEVRRSLLRSTDVQQVAGLWDQMNVAVVGIGNADFSAEMQGLFVDYLNPDTQARLKEQRAAGDICVRFFDVEGRPCRDGVRGVIGTELEQLRGVRRSVGVAGGAAKAEAILGALRGRYINVLVTDVPAARRVLELALLK